MRRRGDEGAVNVGLWVVGEGMVEVGDGRFFGDNAPEAAPVGVVEIWGGFVGLIADRSGGGGGEVAVGGGEFCSYVYLPVCLPLPLPLPLPLSLCMCMCMCMSLCLPFSLDFSRSLDGGGRAYQLVGVTPGGLLHVIRIVRDVAVTRGRKTGITVNHWLPISNKRSPDVSLTNVPENWRKEDT